MQGIVRKGEENHPKIMKENKLQLQAAVSLRKKSQQLLLYSTDLLSPTSKK